MRPTPSHRSPRRGALALIAAALAFAALFMLLGPPRGHAATTLDISTTQNATLDKRILVTTSGRTLYSLSAETRGRFICDDSSCTSMWPPLILKRGAKPAGVRGLSSIRRPDGRRQVTYRGRPLYRFASDRKKGDVNGEGFKDVGTWHAAVAPRSSSAHSSPTQPAPTPGY